METVRTPDDRFAILPELASGVVDCIARSR